MASSNVVPGPTTPAAALGNAMKPDEVDLDSIIDRLLALKGSRPKHADLHEVEIRYLCATASEIFLKQPSLLELEAPLTVHGDVHGQYPDLLKSFEHTAFPPEKKHLFLGNYVDYGKYSIEVMCLILAYKIKYPESLFALRGSHECASISRMNGFYDECKRRYDKSLWKCFVDVFDRMPVAALVGKKVFCVHGGLSPDLLEMKQIQDLPRPIDVPVHGLMCDLLWSDPNNDISGWGENNRGVSFTFGPDVVSRFLQKHELNLIVRGHQLVEGGYEFFAEKRLVTIWGAADFMGEHDDAAAIMSIDESLSYSFQILSPPEKDRAEQSKQARS